MKSDYYLMDLLKSVAGKYALNDATRAYYAEALSKIESDYYRSELLRAFNKDGKWDSRTSNFVLASVSDIKSDYYRSEALRSLIRTDHVNDWASFFNAVAGIDSDHYKRETLRTALDREPLTREIVAGVLSIAPRIKSDYELSEVLSAVARSYKIDENLRPAFERAVDAIDSDYYRGSALSALRRSMSR